MTMITKHQCPSCGGSLTVDNDKQMYRCVSCGSAYDFDYFRAEQLNEMGDTHLSRKEFGAAVDTYRLKLKKNPQDFLALRGLMLAAARLKDMDGLVNAGGKNHFTYNTQMVREVLDSASEEDTGYFEDLARIYYNLNSLSNCYSEIRSLTSTKKRIDQTITLEEQDTNNYKISTGYYSGNNPMEVFIAHWLIALVLLIVMLCIVIPTAVLGDGIIALIAGLFFTFFIGLTVFVNMTDIYPELKEEKEFRAYIRELHSESELTGSKIRSLESEAEDLASGISTSIQEFIEKDRKIISEPVKERVPVVSKIKKHQCPSCGGSLRIDSDKQMYHCTFCGSSYDYEYFKEGRIHEAVETYLSRGEFMATSDAYEFMLKKDPHDYLALRALMLTAAHLTSIDELDQEIQKDGFSYDPGMVRRAIDSASEEDKAYFKELARIYSEKKKITEYNEEIKALYEKKDNINTVIANNNVSRSDCYIVRKDGTVRSPKIMFFLLLGVSAWGLLWAIFFGSFLIYSKPLDTATVAVSLMFSIPGLLAFLGSTGFNLFVVIPKMRKLIKFDKENSELYAEAGKVDEQIKDTEKASSDTMNAIRRSIHDFVRKDRLRTNTGR